MASMDIFAGCGGLSEGMHQAGVAETKWGVEYEPSAARSFQKNNPAAIVFCNNCNVLLRVRDGVWLQGGGLGHQGEKWCGEGVPRLEKAVLFSC